MNTFLPTTIIVGAGGATASTVLSNVGEEETRKQRRNAFVGTGIASVATVAVGASMNCKNYSDYYKQKLQAEQSRQAYVDSLTDEELANALRQMEGQTENIENNNVDSYGNYRK